MMRGLKNGLAAMLWLGAIFCAMPGPAGALDAWIPLREIRIGDKGYGLTVFEGQKIEKFAVEVKALVPASGPDGDEMILVELSGEKIEEYGGVALGMSGSPVYLKGKLAGAVSIAFPETDYRLAGVTPIENMRKLLRYDEVSERKKKMGSGFEVNGRRYASVCVSEAARPDCLAGVPALAPLAVSGLNARAMGKLKARFDRLGIPVIESNRFASKASAAAEKKADPSLLKAGAAAAVQLVRGDVDISAIGTVTEVAGDRVLLFGHPFMRKGEVNMAMAAAYVHAIIVGDPAPYKVGSARGQLGRVVQDRGAAMLGRLGPGPEMMPVKIRVVDDDLEKESDLSLSIVLDEELFPMLLAGALIQAVDNSIDRIGKGTSRISFSIEADGFASNIKRENVHASRYDISVASFDEVVELVDRMVGNEFERSGIRSMGIELHVQERLSLAVIEKAVVMPNYLLAEESDRELKDYLKQLNNTQWAVPLLLDVFPQVEWDRYFDVSGQAKEAEGRAAESETERDKVVEDLFEGSVPDVERGEEVRVRVTLRPYRGEYVKENLILKIPDDFDLGEAVIDVSSGMDRETTGVLGQAIFEVPEENESFREEMEDLGEPGAGLQNLSELVEEFMKKGRNNELVASLMSLGYNAPSSAQEGAAASSESARPPVRFSPEVKGQGAAKKQTPWVIEGQTTVKVNVVDGAGRGRKEQGRKGAASKPRTLK